MKNLTHLKEDFAYEFRWSREFSQALNPHTSSLPEAQQALCLTAAAQFVRNFRETRQSPALEHLEGPEDSNLYTYCPAATAGTLRIVLAIDEVEDEQEGVCVLANAGAQDAMQEWAEAQYYDFDPILAAPLEESYPEAHVLEHARRGDFEAWTQFLYPGQKYLAYKTWAGPACIDGAAGTGKTVIGLHYAATLAHRYPRERILFTTKRIALLTQFHNRFRRLSQVDNVDFIHVDKLAYDIVTESNAGSWLSQWVVDSKVDQAFAEAYQHTIEGTELATLPSQYLRDEIESVIMGGGISNFEEYRNLERWGRIYAFSPESRRHIWSLHTAWQSNLKQRNTPRYVDRLPAARDIVQENAQGIYRSVIVDEIQDMPLVALQFIRSLVVGAPENPLPTDSMLLLGDAAQQIFPGGFSLAEAGIDIADRSRVLYTNYRNTGPIYDAARQVRGEDCVTDNKVDHSLVHTELHSRELPQFIRVEPNGDPQFVGTEIEKLLQDPACEGHHIGILTRHYGQAQEMMAYLTQQRGMDCTLIAKNDTPLGTGVHLGSFNRTKGWEFRVVFIPYLSHAHFPDIREYLSDSGTPGDSRTDAIQQEALILEKGRLYAAMTRARDRLYLIADAEPCPDIRNARAALDWREAT